MKYILLFLGQGTLYYQRKNEISARRFLFVPAGTEHHFENFSDDFATWVMFYGKLGGELNPDV